MQFLLYLYNSKQEVNMNKTVKILLIASLVGNCAIFYVANKALEYRRHINHFLYKYRNVSEEFSGRNIFQDENQPFISDTTVNNRIIFFGTQVTAKYDVKKYYPEYDALNRGIEGQKVAGFLLRFKPDVLDLAPKAVILEISSYNLRAETSIKEIEDYTILLTQLSRYNNIRPILTTIIKPRHEFEDVVEIKELDDYNVFDSVDTYNNWLRNYAQNEKIALVDFAKILGDSEQFLRVDCSDNLVEPNEIGYSLITEAIKENL